MAHGLSKGFIVADSIDQGETISPLIWQIFYDTLLTCIDQDQTLGYILKDSWPDTMTNNSRDDIHQLKVSCTAFADNTA